MVPAQRTLGDEDYVRLFQAAFHEALNRRSQAGGLAFSTLALDVPFTVEAYSHGEGAGPRGSHVREAFARLGNVVEGLTLREGDTSREITCESVAGFPPLSCTTDESTLFMGVTPQRPDEDRGRLQDRVYNVTVVERYQLSVRARGNDASVVPMQVRIMEFRLIDGEWQLVSYGWGAS